MVPASIHVISPEKNTTGINILPRFRVFIKSFVRDEYLIEFSHFYLFIMLLYAEQDMFPFVCSSFRITTRFLISISYYVYPYFAKDFLRRKNAERRIFEDLVMDSDLSPLFVYILDTNCLQR
ncbi:hypothetical protein CEXT_215341 [Caerostris extrusa]|uniref:Uncharacterized protein n=1 Tax=Caerostris extrusa TaxID=172846 RepID=A0AAV4WLT8_CAEEX|nr:hypothetical protein CEXT_215341 [Caerostris extrusa]